jgi:putative acetyltransferase
MIRQMKKQDIGRLEEIWYQESVRVHNWMDDPNNFWDKRRPDFRDTIKKSDLTLVYVEDYIIKGFIIKWQNNYIPELFVDNQYRAYPNGESKKIGRALVDYLKDSESVLTASVYMLNHNAIKFYIKNDFVITKLYTEDTGFCKFWMKWNKESPKSR